jgi:hypothetical protein
MFHEDVLMCLQNNWWMTENFMEGLEKENFEKAHWSCL